MECRRRSLVSTIRRGALAVLGTIGLAVMAGGPSDLVPRLSAGQGASDAARFEIAPGTRVSFRVREQLAGINFPSDAVGTTETITGGFLIGPDGTIDAAHSKLTVDLRTVKTDQQRRDGYIARNTLESEQFPEAIFVPRRTIGLPWPLPIPQPPPAGGQPPAAQGGGQGRGGQGGGGSQGAGGGQGPGGQAAGNRPGFPVGFQLVGDMTIHGVTKEITWNMVTSLTPDGGLHGKAMTNFPFATFNMTRPSVATVLSVEDDIRLEIDFHFTRTTG